MKHECWRGIKLCWENLPPEATISPAWSNIGSDVGHFGGMLVTNDHSPVQYVISWSLVEVKQNYNETSITILILNHSHFLAYPLTLGFTVSKHKRGMFLFQW
jgi:hypothetical protein